MELARGTRLERAQFAALALLNQAPRAVRPRRLPLVAPLAWVRTGAGSLSSIYKDVFVRRIYAPRRALPAAPRFLDCGAHVGLASMFFLSGWRGAHVTAIEGNPRTVPLLRQNLVRWRGRCTIVGRPVAPEPGPASFYVTRRNPQNVNAGLSNRAAEAEEVERLDVDCIGVEEVVDGPFDLAKIDIEGTEYGLLASERFEPGTVRELVVELHDVHARADEFRAIVHALAARGYGVSGDDGRSLGPRDVDELPVGLGPGEACCLHFEA